MRRAISRRSLVAAAAIIAVPRFAMASATFPDFPTPSADKSIAFGNGDLAILAYPLPSSEDQRTYFRLDLNGAGVLPIWLSITNQSAAERFMVDADDINLAYGDVPIKAAERSRSTIDDSAGRVTENLAAIGMAAGPVGMAVSLPILLMSGGVIARQDDIRRNLMVRQFYSRTLGPGQSAVGFVYGKTDRRAADLSQYRLGIVVKPVPAGPDSPGVAFQAALAGQAPSLSPQQQNSEGAK
jgi:hypothetical protein